MYKHLTDRNMQCETLFRSFASYQLAGCVVCTCCCTYKFRKLVRNTTAQFIYIGKLTEFQPWVFHYTKRSHTYIYIYAQFQNVTINWICWQNVLQSYVFIMHKVLKRIYIRCIVAESLLQLCICTPYTHRGRKRERETEIERTSVAFILSLSRRLLMPLSMHVHMQII